MIPGFGKQTLVIGSGPQCDLRLGGPGVAEIHARLVHQGGGNLVLVDAGSGSTTANGAPLAPNASVPFDFRNQYMLGQTPLSTAQRAIVLMLMSEGKALPKAGALTIGRDPARAHVVINHPNVSSHHATFQLAPLSVTDHGSTAGTWLGKERLAQGQAVALEPHAIVALGPVPLPAGLIAELHAGLTGSVAPASVSAAVSQQLGAEAEPQAARVPGAKHKTVLGQVAVGPADHSTTTIGRTPDNDIQIANAQVSSRHAVLHKVAGQLFLEDRGSANGTYVRGQRIPAGQRVPVASGEKVFIGPMPLLLRLDAQELAVVVEDSAQWAGKPLYEIEAWDLSLQVPDRDNPSALKTLLDHVSFRAMPGDLIALMGPSGAGKTTLLLALNGYLPPSSGQVRINGENLYAIYDALRGSIGYVPQDDIVHPELTVWEAVRYSAKFRLPPDYSDEEIDRRVSTTLTQLGLESVAHLQIGKPEKKVLSGGQRKRVNIAMELVTDPVIMFLDEPTSGLAADDTTALVHLLSDLARQTGKTIITTIHQPAKAEFERFNLALILGPGGKLIFYGPAQDGYKFFGGWLTRTGRPSVVDNPRDMFDVLNQRERHIHEALKARDPSASRAAARQQAALEWHGEFFAPDNPVFQKMYSGRRAVGTGSEHQSVPRSRPPTKGQFGLLLSRYFVVKTRDLSGTLIMLLQAPIIGVLLAVVFGGQKESIPYWCLGALQELAARSGGLGTGADNLLKSMQTTPDHSAAINFLIVAAVWFGTSNAAREIVSERAIYTRERMVNLGLFNYVASKFFLLSLFCVVQCSILLSIVFFALGFHGGLAAFGVGLVTMTVTAMNSVVVGLVLSSLVVSAEAAMALTPIALIPQVVLSGLMVPMTTNTLLEWPMYLIPARWGFQGLIAQERRAIAQDPAWLIDIGKPDLTSPDSFITSGKFECATAQIASNDLIGAWGFSDYQLVWLPPTIMVAMMTALLLFVLVILKRRDSV